MAPAPQSRKMHSVFFTIFFSLLLVLVIELTLLIGTIIVGQVPSQLDDNAEEVLCEQVENRSGYLQNFLVSSQELTALSTYINSQTEVSSEIVPSAKSAAIFHRYLCARPRPGWAIFRPQC